MSNVNLKDRILKERGLVKVKERKPGHQRDTFGKFAPAPKAVISGKRKTPLMKYLEQKYNVALEEILVSGSLSIIAKRLGGEVDVTTISRWIKRFNLRYSEDNLPDCTNCRHRGPACEGGVCLILMESEQWDLVLLKKEVMLNEGNQNPTTAVTELP